MTDTQSFTETLVEAATKAAVDAIGIDPLAIAIIVEAAITAILPLLAAETVALNAAGERVAAEQRQAQGAYELTRDERDWWKARADEARADRVREAKGKDLADIRAELVREERAWWKARAERFEAALREAKSAVGEVAEIMRGSYNVSSDKLVEILDKAETGIDAALTPSPKEPKP